jgi:hypothetical protein
MADIDEERLQELMELVCTEHPDLDKYVVWVLCINQLLNEQGIYGDENAAEEIRQKRHKEAQFKVMIQ